MFFNTLATLALVACVASAPVTERAACSPLELVFARGTNEADLGLVGTPLSRSLSSLVPGATVYNVNYPSTPEYVVTVAQGAQDAASHIQSQAAACPDQKFALAGYSKGAMVAHQTSLPVAVQAKVIAVAVFGDPLRTSGDAFPVNDQADVIGFCNTGDPVCLNGANILAHLAYGSDGSTTKAAQFIASHYSA